MVCPGGPSSSANVSVFPLRSPGDFGWEESVSERDQVLLSEHLACHLVHEAEVGENLGLSQNAEATSS